MIYYVNANAPRGGNGLKETPFRRVSEAAAVARPGDEILVAPGVYREAVHPACAGTEENRITYRSETPLGAEITGAELLTGWKKTRGGIWTARVPSRVFGGYNPYTEKVEGDWYFAPDVRHTGQLYLNDLPMAETTTLAETPEVRTVNERLDERVLGPGSLVRDDALAALPYHRGVHGGVHIGSGGFHYCIPKFGHGLAKCRVLVTKMVNK